MRGARQDSAPGFMEGRNLMLRELDARPDDAEEKLRAAPHGDSRRAPSFTDLPVKTPDESEQRVIRQLVEALLFEGLVDAQTRPRRSADVRFDDVEAVYDLQIDFTVGRHAFRCLAAIRAFSRVRVAQRSVANSARTRSAIPT
jgi:hypothetical protein